MRQNFLKKHAILHKISCEIEILKNEADPLFDLRLFGDYYSAIGVEGTSGALINRGVIKKVTRSKISS